MNYTVVLNPNSVQHFTHGCNISKIDNKGSGARINGHEFARPLHNLKATDLLIIVKKSEKAWIRVQLHSGGIHILRGEVVFVDPELAAPILKRVAISTYGFSNFSCNSHHHFVHCFRILGDDIPNYSVMEEKVEQGMRNN